VFKESVRDRVLYAIGAFALLLVAGSIAIGQITAGQDLKIIKDLGLATIEVAGVLMAVFIGVGLVAREIERRSIFGLLAKPVPRWEFVIGKFIGLVLTLAVNVWAMAAALFVALAWQHWTTPAEARMAWEAPAMDPRLLVQVLLVNVELALLTAIALFFSTFSSSALLSVVFTIGLFIVGLSSEELRNFNVIVDAPAFGWLVSGIGWIVPAFSAFDIKSAVVHGLPFGGASFVALTLGYAAIYIVTVLAAATAIFSRREFK
jgi:ABC-type transport system involved in multi-copper enzyme maturation permease subunit